MSKWEKLLKKLLFLSKDTRFNELQKNLGILWICYECTEKWK